MCAHPPVYKWGWGHTLHFYLDKYTVKIHFGNRPYLHGTCYPTNLIFTVNSARDTSKEDTIMLKSVTSNQLGM